jgi:predicted transcriptional regulator
MRLGNVEEGIKKSLKVRFKERRGKLEIIADILSVADNGVKKTEMVYKANVNFKRIEEYLSFLVEKGLLEPVNGKYRTTAKGKEYLRDYQILKDRLLREQ